MKKLIYIITVLLICLKGYSQCNWSNSLVFNTGLNNTTNSLGLSGNLDPNWRLINLPIVTTANTNASLANRVAGITPLPTQVGLNQAYIIQRFSPNWNNNNLGNEMPISANNVATFNLNNFDANQPYRFVREFCVRQNDQFNLNLSIKGDDAARLTIYDNNNIAQVSYTTINGLNSTTYSLGNTSNFNNNQLNGWNLNQNINLSSGTYTIEIEMVASNSTAMGVTLSGGLTSNSNSNSLSYSINCCNVGTIGLVKYLDQNCNQNIDVNDNIQPNVSFSLIQGNSIIQTQTTNPLTGELFFRNIPFGVYSLVENNTGFTLLNNPGAISINQNTPSQFFTLFNCPPQPPSFDCCNEGSNLKLSYTKDNDVANVPNGASWSQNVPLSITEELWTINQTNVIPIIELKVNIQDFEFTNNIDACASCVNNPGHWASLGYKAGQWQNIGSGSNKLNPTTGYNPILGDRMNLRELVWKNSNGVILNSGDQFSFNLIFPPFSKIPCCTTSVKVCYKVSWKDANCNVCEETICVTYDLR